MRIIDRNPLYSYEIFGLNPTTQRVSTTVLAKNIDALTKAKNIHTSWLIDNRNSQYLTGIINNLLEFVLLDARHLEWLDQHRKYLQIVSPRLQRFIYLYDKYPKLFTKHPQFIQIIKQLGDKRLKYLELKQYHLDFIEKYSRDPNIAPLIISQIRAFSNTTSNSLDWLERNPKFIMKAMKRIYTLNNYICNPKPSKYYQLKNKISKLQIARPKPIKHLQQDLKIQSFEDFLNSLIKDKNDPSRNKEIMQIHDDTIFESQHNPIMTQEKHNSSKMFLDQDMVSLNQTKIDGFFEQITKPKPTRLPIMFSSANNHIMQNILKEASSNSTSEIDLSLLIQSPHDNSNISRNL